MEQLLRRNIKPFDGENYNIWKLRIRRFFSEQNLLKVLDNDPPHPITAQWKQLEEKAMNIIFDYVADSHLSYIRGKNSTREIIESFERIFNRKSITKEILIRKRLSTLKFAGDTELIKHLNLFEDQMEQLINAGATVSEREKIGYLFPTLPKCYESKTTAIETMNEDHLTYNYAKDLLLDYETKIRDQTVDTSEKVLQATANEAVSYHNEKKVNKNKKNIKILRKTLSNKIIKEIMGVINVDVQITS